MIRNWYNQIPHPALKTKRKITKHIKFTKGTRGKQTEQLFPTEYVSQTSNWINFASGGPNFKMKTVLGNLRIPAFRKIQNDFCI